MRYRSVLVGMLVLTSGRAIVAQQPTDAIAVSARRVIDGAGRTLDNAAVIV